MSRLSLCLAVLLILAATGCRTDPSIELLETELRWLEDQLYSLEDDYEQKCAELESCRRENDALRRRAGDTTGAEPDVGSTRRSAPSGRDTGPGLLAPPMVQPGTIEPPKIELPAPLGPPMSQTGGSDIRQVSAESVDPEVTHVVLNPRLTGGYDFDSQPGDEGVQVVIEPRNAAGQYVPLAGPVSVVVLDPAETGQDARVARWDFDSIDTGRVMKKTLLGRGIHLEMPWPNQPPRHSELHLFVRYVTLDGQKLEADRPIRVDLPGQISNRWTPAAASLAEESPRSHSTGVARAISTEPSANAVAIPAEVSPASAQISAESAAADRPLGETAGTRSVLVRPSGGVTTESPAAPARQAQRPRPTWAPQR